MSENEKENAPTPPAVEVSKTGANKGKKKQILFEDTIHGDVVDVDSNEEWYTFGFICELHRLGLIKDFVYQPESFPLTPKFNYTPVVPMGAKPAKEKFLFHPHIYTADFKISAYVDSAKLISYFSLAFKIPKESVKVEEETGRLIADIYMDVKGEWMQYGSESFSINQKLVYERFGIYINKFVPRQAFQKMGAPPIAVKTPTGRLSKVFGGMKFIETVFSSLPDLGK